MPTLTLPGELSSLEAIADLVLEQARVAGLDKHATYQLRLAVDELATNIVIHGYQEHGLTGNIVISADVDEHDLTIVLEDTAVPYDPTQRDFERVEESFEQPLEEREIGGLGIYFVRKAVNDFRYEWRNGRNSSMLVVHLPAIAGVAIAERLIRSRAAATALSRGRQPTDPGVESEQPRSGDIESIPPLRG